MWKEKTTDIKQLKSRALSIRKNALLSLNAAASGHTGASLGLADIFTVLYFSEMDHNPQNPSHPDRDRFILSVGHAAPGWYAALSEAGYFPKEELLSLRKLGSRLQGHPATDHGLPGLESSSGSLGQGLSVAVGMALADKLDNKNRRVFCLLGDGELQEGSVWEAAMSAAHHSLQRLIAIVDRNELQIDGKTNYVMTLEPLADKWKAFGWEVINCNGNDIEELLATFQKIKDVKHQKPIVIVAKTIMGKGVKSIEGDYRWHGKVPSDEKLAGFLEELESGR